MTRILRSVSGLIVLYMCVINAGWADDYHHQKMTKQLITSSYMIRFHSYFAEEAENYANLLDPEAEQQKAEQALALLREGQQGAEIQIAWVEFERTRAEFEKIWQEQRFPSWYALQDYDAAHMQLVNALKEVGGDSAFFEDNLAFLSLMEFYLYRSTPVASANMYPRGNEYDSSVEVDKFDQRMQLLDVNNHLERGDVIRWKYIKPLFSSKDMIFSPMIVMRHGGALSRAFVEG